MDVTISRGVVWQDDLRNVAPDQWPELIGEYRQFCQRNLPTDCRSLLRMMSEGEHVGWAGFNDRETYLREGLGLDPEAANWAIAGLGIAGVEVPVEYAKAQKLGRWGGPRPIRDSIEQVTDRHLDDAKTNRASSESRAGIIAKLRRDHHDDLADRVEAKKIPARAAALAAGIIKETPPLTKLRRAWKRASPEERAIFRAEIAA